MRDKIFEAAVRRLHKLGLTRDEIKQLVDTEIDRVTREAIIASRKG